MLPSAGDPLVIPAIHGRPASRVARHDREHEPSADDLVIATLAGSEAELREELRWRQAREKDLKSDCAALRECLSVVLELLHRGVERQQRAVRLIRAKHEIERTREAA